MPEQNKSESNFIDTRGVKFFRVWDELREESWRTFELGHRLPVFSKWVYVKEKWTFYIFITGGSFVSWGKHHWKFGFYIFTETEKWGCCLLVWWHFREMVSGSLTKTFLGVKLARGFWKDLHLKETEKEFTVITFL